MRIVAIHQPNFFPWLGYFDKLVRADVFVLLDSVQFPKKGGTWMNRVKVAVNGAERWLTAPVDRSYHGYKDVSEIVFEERQPWRKQLLDTLSANYGRAPRFEEVMTVLSPLLLNPENNLARYNAHAICALAAALGASTDKVRFSSRLGAAGASNELLINLTRQLSGSAYMCGGGAAGYQDDAQFAAAGLDLIYQRFEHPVYPQFNTAAFVPGLSIIDALMNVGLDGVRALLGIT